MAMGCQAQARPYNKNKNLDPKKSWFEWAKKKNLKPHHIQNLLLL